MFKILLATLTALTLGACAPSGDKDSRNRQDIVEQEDRQKLTEIYKPVLGYYRGTLNTSAAPKMVEMQLFTVEEQNGTYPDGSPRNTLALKGNLVFISPVEASLKLSVRFFPETGEMFFTNSNQNIGEYQVHTISARFKRQSGSFPPNIVGEVTSMSGFYGMLNLDLSQRPSDTGSTDEDQYYKRLAKEYEAVAGVFAGKNYVDGKATFGMRLQFQIIRDIANPKIPILVGQFIREDAGDSSDMILSVVYQPELIPPKLTIVGIPRYYGNTDYRALFSGTLENKVFKGQWQSNILGPQGEFELKKIKEGKSDSESASNADSSSGERPKKNPRR